MPGHIHCVLYGWIASGSILGHMAERRPDIPTALKRAVLVEAGHRCAIPTCRTTTTEIAHIIPWREVRRHKFDNLIALCPTCHSRYDRAEIDRKAMQTYKSQLGALNRRFRSPWPEHAVTLDELDTPAASSVAELLSKIGASPLWDPDVRQSFLSKILTLSDSQRFALIGELTTILTERTAGDQVRWNAALVVEFLVQWDPLKVSAELLLTMSNDPSFSVRSSAAVSYYYLAGSSPDVVPVEVLSHLASAFEDWYVTMPATNALLRLARTRGAAVEVLAAAISHESKDVRDHAAHALERLAKVHPAGLRHDIADRMVASDYPPLVEVGKTWKRIIEEYRAAGGTFDHQMF